MASLYYGKGECSVQGNVASLVISYRGNIIIDSKLPDGYTVVLGKNQLIIEPFVKSHFLSELFSYLGELRITRVMAKDLEGESLSVAINRAMDYSELLHSKSEDLTVKSEDLKVGYKHGKKINKTRALPKVINNLHTKSLDRVLYIGSEVYKGNYHLHIDGTVMSGRQHTKDSQILKERRTL